MYTCLCLAIWSTHVILHGRVYSPLCILWQLNSIMRFPHLFMVTLYLFHACVDVHAFSCAMNTRTNHAIICYIILASIWPLYNKLCLSCLAVYRIEIDEHVVSGNDLKIVTSRKKKRVKKGDITKKDLRNMLLYISNGAHCDCRHLGDLQPPNRNGGKRDKKTYLAMGTRRGDKLVLQYLIRNSKENKDLKRAWKAMKKGEICQDGLHELHQNGHGRRNKGKKSPPNTGSDVLQLNEPNVPSESPSTDHNNDNAERPTIIPNTNTKPKKGGKKRRKKCKNPKKCISTEQPEEDRRREKERSGRRKARRRQRGSKNTFMHLFSI